MWRTGLAIALCLLLGLTGQAMAFAGASGPAEDRVVICSGHGSSVVYVDKDGQPTTPPELCLDCLTLLSALAAEPPRIATVLGFARSLAPVAPRVIDGAAIAQVYSARAPPVVSVL